MVCITRNRSMCALVCGNCTPPVKRGEPHDSVHRPAARTVAGRTFGPPIITYLLLTFRRIVSPASGHTRALETPSVVSLDPWSSICGDRRAAPLRPRLGPLGLEAHTRALGGHVVDLAWIAHARHTHECQSTLACAAASCRLPVPVAGSGNVTVSECTAAIIGAELTTALPSAVPCPRRLYLHAHIHAQRTWLAATCAVRSAITDARGRARYACMTHHICTIDIDFMARTIYRVRTIYSIVIDIDIDSSGLFHFVPLT